MADEDGEKPLLRKPHGLLHRHEKQQQCQRDNHGRHDQRDVDHEVEQAFSREVAIAHQGKCCQCAQQHRSGGRRQRHLERQNQAADNFMVMHHRAVPLEGPAAPEGDHARIVERIHHQYHNGQVEEQVDQDHPGQGQHGGLFHRAPSRLLVWYLLNTAIGSRMSTIITMATAEARCQSRLRKNSFHITLPMLSVDGPASSSGMTYSPTAGMNTSRLPAMMPDLDSGTVTSQKVLNGVEPRSAAASTSR